MRQYIEYVTTLPVHRSPEKLLWFKALTEEIAELVVEIYGPDAATFKWHILTHAYKWIYGFGAFTFSYYTLWLYEVTHLQLYTVRVLSCYIIFKHGKVSPRNQKALIRNHWVLPSSSYAADKSIYPYVSGSYGQTHREL